MQKILITGANGLLGQKLIDLLLHEPSVQLIATGKGANRHTETASYSYEQLDITKEQNIAEVFAKTKPNVVINTAAMTNVDQCESERELCWLMNVTAVEYLAKACEQYNSQLIHLSTDFIFDGKNGPYDEAAKANSLSYYGDSKLAAEKIVLQSKCRWAIARTILVYGIVNDMSRSNIILWVKNNLEAGKTINVVTDQWRTPTLAEDLAMGCWLIAKHNAEGIFNISGKDLLTPYDMAIQTAEYFKLDKSLIKMADSSTFSQPAVRPARTGFIIDKAKLELGYAPHSFMEGIEILAGQLG